MSTCHTIFHERHISSVTFMSAHLDGNFYIPVRGLRSGQFIHFCASVGAKFHKMCDSLPRMPMNRRANFDAISFFLGGESVTVQTQKITVIDISTPCLSACVNKNHKTTNRCITEHRTILQPLYKSTCVN